MIKYFFTLVAVFALAFTSMTCHGPTEPGGYNTFTLSLSDTSCTEAWFDVHLGSSFRERTVEIKRDTQVVMMFALLQTDTTVSDTGLLPKKAYSYVAQLRSGTSLIKATTALHVETLDTTSNNFSWTTYTLGNGGSTSSLYDVAIVNDTLAYAVGEIDGSNGYGLAKWDGQQWTLHRVYAYTPEGYLQNIRPLRGVIAFSGSDVWLADGNVYHWNSIDSLLTPYWISGYPGNPAAVLGLNQGVGKLWGTSDENLYGGGINGGLAWYNGTIWQKLSSGTSLDIQNIYGAWNGETKHYEILAVASSYPESLDRRILFIDGQQVTQLASNPIQWPLSSVWFVPGRRYIVAGSGIYEKHLLNGPQWSNDPLTVTPYYTYSLRGNGINDIVAVGGYGECLHFNGRVWKSFHEVTGSGGNYYSVAIRGNLVIAIGQTTSQGFVAIGKRSQ